MLDPQEIELFFEEVLWLSVGVEQELQGYALVAGGNANTAVRLQTADGVYFIKFSEAIDDRYCKAEYKGLELLDKTIAEASIGLAVPKVIGYGFTKGYAYLLSEFIDTNLPSRYFWKQLGEGLANLHVLKGQQSGLNADNFIGTLAQSNLQTDNWPTFWAQRRLIATAGLALLDEAIPLSLYKRIESLCQILPNILPEKGLSLLHGDLWNGNVLPGRKPYLIDPAVYFGHSEVDLAMTRLFGGFPTQFYEAYQEVLPFESGWDERLDIYTLYPLLVHVNLFGEAYIPGVEKVLKRFDV